MTNLLLTVADDGLITLSVKEGSATYTVTMPSWRILFTYLCRQETTALDQYALKVRHATT